MDNIKNDLASKMRMEAFTFRLVSPSGCVMDEVEIEDLGSAKSPIDLARQMFSAMRGKDFVKGLKVIRHSTQDRLVTLH